MAAVVELIWAENEAEYLCRHDWTGQISLIRQEKFDFRRGAIEPLRPAVLRSHRAIFAIPAKAKLALRRRTAKIPVNPVAPYSNAVASCSTSYGNIHPAADIHLPIRRFRSAASSFSER